MAYFQTFRSDGALQFDASMMTMSLIAKGTVTTQSRLSGTSNPSSALIPLPNLTDPIIIAYRSTFYAARAGRYLDNGQAVAHLACSGAVGSTLDYYLFNRTNVYTPAYPGLNLWDEAGNLTYSSARPICTISWILSGNGQSADLSPNRIYAMASQEWTGYRRNTGAVYRNGQPWEPGDGGNTLATWSYRNEQKLYGCAVNGANVSTGNVSYNDVMVSLGSSRSPLYPPASATWTRPMGNVLVIDVTGL